MPDLPVPLRDALRALSERALDELPLSSTPELAAWMRNIFSHAITIAESVPVPKPPRSSTAPVGRIIPVAFPDSVATSSPTNGSNGNKAKSNNGNGNDKSSPWRSINWKQNPRAHENPLAATLHTAYDDQTSWFTRRSLLRGLDVATWSVGFRREFADALKAVGGPGEGGVRGIAADRRLLKKVVDGVGVLEVYVLSANFGITDPRDFVTLLLSSTNALPAPSPRHHLIVSIPLTHPSVPEAAPFIRGNYSSVELVREIAVPAASSSSHTPSPQPTTSKNNHDSASPSDLSSTTKTSGSSATTRSQPLVDWIMVTHSDPGGRIARFMVDMRSPPSIASDAAEFAKWLSRRAEEFEEDAAKFPELVDLELDEEEVGRPGADDDGAAAAASAEKLEISSPPRSSSMSTGAGGQAEREGGVSPATRPVVSRADTFEPSRPEDTGIIAALTGAVGVSRAGRGSGDTTPASGKAGRMPGGGEDVDWGETDDDVDSDSGSSFASWASARDGETDKEEEDGSVDALGGMTAPDEGTSVESIGSVGEMGGARAKDGDKGSKDKDKDKEKDKRTQRYERQIAKLEAKKRAVEAKAAKREEKAREREERKRGAGHGPGHGHGGEEGADGRAKDKDKDKERRDLERARRERDEARRTREIERRENEVLRARVGELQRENTWLVRRVGGVPGGQDILRELRRRK